MSDIGLGGEDLIFCADHFRVDAARTLVGHGGKVITVKDDDAATLDGRNDELLDVLAPVVDEVFQLIFYAEPARGCTVSELLSPRSIGRLEALHNLATALSQSFGEHGGLSRLSRPIDAFDDNEVSFGLRGCCAWWT